VQKAYYICFILVVRKKTSYLSFDKYLSMKNKAYVLNIIFGVTV